MTSRILVTGASGFVGQRVLPHLVERGFEVVALGRSDPPVSREGVTYVRCDLLDPDQTRRAVKDAQASHLLHLAWRAVVSGLWSAPENMDWLLAGLHLVRCFQESGGKRATVVGSCGEYDWSAGLCKEGVTPLLPNTYYGSVKLALYHALNGFSLATKMELAWGRIFFLYGPGEHASRLGASVVTSLLSEQPALCSHGMQLRDYMHVDDAASGLAALAASSLVGEFNLATGVAVRVRDVIASLGEAAGRPDLIRLGARPAPGHEPPLIVADMGKTKQSGLDWSPRFSLEDGAIDTVRWFRDNRE